MYDSSLDQNEFRHLMESGQPNTNVRRLVLLCFTLDENMSQSQTTSEPAIDDTPEAIPANDSDDSKDSDDSDNCYEPEDYNTLNVEDLLSEEHNSLWISAYETYSSLSTGKDDLKVDYLCEETVTAASGIIVSVEEKEREKEVCAEEKKKSKGMGEGQER